MSDRLAIHSIIHGRVQGVWYRGWTEETATRLGLDGWVRNLSDGTVEAVFAGPSDAVEEMVAACAEGPDLAQVTGIDRRRADDPGPGGFSQRPTA